MRIQFMTQVLPFPLDAGPKLRAHHVIRYLAEAGHQVHLLSFIRPGETDEHVNVVRRMCASVETVPMVRSRMRDVRDGIRSVWTSRPFLVLRDHQAAMQEALERSTSLRSIDALHIDQLWMAPYGMSDRVSVGLKVLDQHNAVFMVPSRMADHHPNKLVRTLLRHEAARLEVFEREACRRFDRVVWVTHEDRQAVLGDAGNHGTANPVIPIAADPTVERPLARPRPFRVTFLGGLHWPPNREGVMWFVDSVWPRIAQALPSAVLTLIGKQGRTALPLGDRTRRVEAPGYVRDPRRLLSETSVFVVPLLSGAGMRVKILDAWCWGLPVVSTTVGAEGLSAAHGENLLIADQADAFADSVIRIARQRHLADRLALAGRTTVEAQYDWQTAYRAWDDIYEPARRQSQTVA